MSSLVERLRVRSEKRPLYTLDESDDDLPPRGGGGKGRDRHSDGPTERIEREDALFTCVCRKKMLARNVEKMTI
ncbi:Os06g0183800 [Oryza sativa Japonica Group]|uniref:Os06g0183800 protein n=1 Tax=Oryza sativa subsp. japonica TaxID=39947 RepID=C7J450_ORYSJ|nr:Os06g0183800 [Oryza sativa Japonica Group]|eukprot:NP_001174639.1 Os06g0183800 [Oryza sativa Japonica Group]